MLKYNRTFHLHYSQKSTSDDKKHKDDSMLKGKYVVALEKLDGENTTMLKDYSHARSRDSLIDDESRSMIEAYRVYLDSMGLFEDNPRLDRLVGENMVYLHTVPYDNLSHFFYCFNIAGKDGCYYSWEDFLSVVSKYGIIHPNVIYEGLYDKDEILAKYKSYKESNPQCEGFVIRNVDAFSYDDFSLNVGKYVDKGFEITTSSHWRSSVKSMNKLKDNRNFWELIK